MKRTFTRLLAWGIAALVIAGLPGLAARYTDRLDPLEAEVGARDDALTGTLDKAQKKAKKAYAGTRKILGKSTDSLLSEVKLAGKAVRKLKKVLPGDEPLSGIVATALDGLSDDVGGDCDATESAIDGAPAGKKHDKARSVLEDARSLLASSRTEPDPVRRAKGLGKAMKVGSKASKLATKAMQAGAGAAAFVENWERGSPGVYSPTKGQGRKITAAHTWYLQDTITEFADCGQTPQKAEILNRDGSKLLRLTSVASGTDCADNVWIVTTGSGAKITQGTTISFRETGYLEPEGSFGKYTNYFFDRIKLAIIDARGNELWYTLQHRDGIDVFESGSFRELFPEPDGQGVYTRDLYADFLEMTAFVPGTKIDHILLEVDSVGWAELDDLRITGK